VSRPKRLSESQVAIVGLGLMGGSLALALQGHCSRLLGCDLDPETRKLARERSVVDLVDSDLKNILPKADVIVLATPVFSILDLLRDLHEYHTGPVVVMDLGSTKTDIVRTMDELPPTFDPIGGHPVCGGVSPGLMYADAMIYHGAPFALTPLPRTTNHARSIAEELVEAVNAKPLWLEAATHDTWVAATSHLPYLLAVGLLGATTREASPLIGPGFVSASRLAASNPEMMKDIFLTNREAVLEVIRKFATEMRALEVEIREGDPRSIEERFERTVELHQKLVLNREGA
jgi:prephenate dehydrogenase